MTTLWLDSPRRFEKNSNNNNNNKLINKISTDNAEIKKITIEDVYEQLYANEFDNLEEMHNFLETHSLQKLNKEEIYQVNRPITRNASAYIIKKKNILYKPKSRTRWLQR